MTHKHLDLAILCLVGIACGLVVAIVLDVATDRQATECQDTYEPRDMYPSIPQCDRDLWDRIREGCT